MIIGFAKMHGARNDFVVVDDRDRKLNVTPELAARILDRRAGVGGDQLLVIRNSKEADFEMRMYNADGSEIEMCGNGIRCAALFARKIGIKQGAQMSVKTLAGIRRPVIEGDAVRVDMGEPEFSGPLIPVNLPGEVFDHSLDVGGKRFMISCVSMGNPHCVIEVEDPDGLDVEKWGPLIERHQLFPNRVNVEFIRVMDKRNIRMRVWERGSGETPACGTGACASAVVCARKGLTEREVNLHLDGGELRVQWSNDGTVFLTGPAAFVFEGEIEIN
jgi:diaminopimelate epimerase